MSGTLSLAGRCSSEAGAAGVHFEDQLASEKKCGHLGGKVLVPTQEAIQKLVAARLAADIMDVPTVVCARTDANAANLLTSDIDDRDKPFCTGERSPEGFHYVKSGLKAAIQRGQLPAGTEEFSHTFSMAPWTRLDTKTIERLAAGEETAEEE